MENNMKIIIRDFNIKINGLYDIILKNSISGKIKMRFIGEH
jgi:hypothetical protein